MSIPVTEILGFTPMQQERGRHHKPQTELAFLEEHPDAWLTAHETRCVGYVPLGSGKWTQCPRSGVWEVRGRFPGPYCARRSGREQAMSEPFDGDVSRSQGWVQMFSVYVTTVGGAFKAEAVLSYWESEPLQVCMSFPRIGVRWRFARDLLSDGLVMPSGEGRVRVQPKPLGLWVRFDSASALFDHDEVVDFLAHTVNLVTPGYEQVDIPDDVSSLEATR